MTNKPRIVVDTNVAISALLRKDSVPGRAIVKVMESGELIVSNETLVELLDILLSPKFDRYVPIEIREEFLGRLQLRALHVNITSTVSVCRDPKDDKFLELAVDGGASYLITGDQDLLVLDSFRGIRVVTPRDFLESSKLP